MTNKSAGTFTDSLSSFTQYEARELIQICKNGRLYPFSDVEAYFPEITHRAIEIAGMPYSFKSTLILHNTVQLRRNRIKADYIKERVSLINKRLFPAHYSITLANKTIEELLAMTKDQVYLLDRGTYDQIAFLYTYKKFGFIDQQTFESASDYLTRFGTNKISGVIICQSKPEDCLKQEGVRNTPGFVMNYDFLRGLYESYKALPKLITETRARCGLGTEPFPVIYLERSISWDECSSLFLQSTTTLLKLNMYNL